MKYLSIICILLMLIACAQPAEEKTPAKELSEQLKEQVEPEVKEEIVAETPEPTKEEAVPEVAEVPEEKAEEPEAIEETVSPSKERTKMYNFLDIFAEKVNSYQFINKGNHYFVKGNRYKVILKIPVIAKEVSFGDIEKRLFYYDTVYVDRATKTAIAYCEGHTSQVNTQCSQLELYDLAYPVPYQDYDVTLPEDWLLSNLDREPKTWDENKYYIENRASITVTFGGDEQLELDFDPGSGLVMRADQKQGDRLISRNDYQDLAINLVRDVDVNHRSKSEIPSEESFYR